MIERLKPAVSAALGSPIRSHARAHGGDINDAFDVTLTDGRRIFVKTNARADRRMFSCEARGLDWLRETNALRVPRVLAHGEAPPFLALEHIASASRAADFDERLGRGLAALHRSGAPRFGFDEPNFIGSLTQDNAPCETWPAFYVERRLDPQVRAAVDTGHAPAGWTRLFAQLFTSIDDLVGATEPPARLHGDLWSGNVMTDDTGAPCLIDPAVYGGHREIDLAMLRLFGGLSPHVLAAYREAAPLAPGHESRVALYQLYPLLVHVNLFGGGYVASVERALRAYV
jgi:fructosamine-3-kinase